MARVITFSRFFPKGHRKEGKPTFFVEKIWASLVDQQKEFPEFWPGWFNLNSIHPFNGNSFDKIECKHHTIRSGKWWKVGDKFSPRIWTGTPYRSKMCVIGPDIEIKKVFDIEIDEYKFIINGKLFYHQHVSRWHSDIEELAKNDGLDAGDLFDWFNIPCKFSGQVICWNENINY